MSENKEKKWSEMTYEERRALLPKNLNKVGEHLLSGERYLEIVDIDAVMK